mmetsp:Transcript_15528/g.36019  ORF Transcript_15528/g.36019 Transcript_15528/m.36019 type:complete len:195 (+) Transcript_15528:638-1222(+)
MPPRRSADAARSSHNTFELGLRLYLGEAGVLMDYDEAVQLFRIAADQGHANAQHSTGVVYRDQRQDYGEATRWFRLSGLATAQYNLAALYHKDTGVHQSDGKAARYSRLAADQGFAEAQRNIGNCLLIGEGVAQDVGEAACYYRLAADQGHVDAMYSLARRYCADEGGLPQQDYGEAARWFRLAADQGYAEAVR